MLPRAALFSAGGRCTSPGAARRSQLAPGRTLRDTFVEAFFLRACEVSVCGNNSRRQAQLWLVLSTAGACGKHWRQKLSTLGALPVVRRRCLHLLIRRRPRVARGQTEQQPVHAVFCAVADGVGAHLLLQGAFFNLVTRRVLRVRRDHRRGDDRARWRIGGLIGHGVPVPFFGESSCRKTFSFSSLDGRR